MKFLQYVLEIKFYIIYNLYILIFLSLSLYYYFDDILYLLLKPLYNIIYIKKKLNMYLIYTNLTDILLIYIKLYLFILIYLYSLFTINHFFVFLLNSFYFYEKQIYFIIKYLFIFLCVIVNIINYFVIIPFIFYFFLQFEKKNNVFFNIYFEGKFNEYINLILYFLLNMNLFVLIPIIFFLANLLKIVNYKFLLKFRKIFYFFLVLFSSILSPPDFFILFIFISIYIFLFEIYIFFQIIFNNLFLKL